MKIFKLISIVIVTVFFGTTANAQKKKPSAPSKQGPIEMPANTETQTIPNDEKFNKIITKINEAVTFKYDASYKNADVYILKDGKATLMYKVKSNDTGIDTKLKARIYNKKVYSPDGKQLLFTYETETAATSLIKLVFSSPEKKFLILDFSQVYESDAYTMTKSETFEKHPIFYYYSFYTNAKSN
ncbi:hypothetical protein QF023_000438 [Chryseobacterium sp. SLBN-27]|jgi:hypothetical protein|uniref:hypothetical protein n=1 Tax=Chryseobacterium sp. SLBN-27 TaxID=3042287 RepID=UPI002866F842|nr:hypothetical protein [Chryseobacterium sp. SLBN-27]MDR6156922.1 hypothetical protein [Chryseobacterium sp. SLBN-27]